MQPKLGNIINNKFGAKILFTDIFPWRLSVSRSFPRASLSEQIISKDKYPCILSRQMEVIVYIFRILRICLPRLWFGIFTDYISARFGIKLVICFLYLPRSGSLPNSPLSTGMPPSRLERKLTIKAKELKDARQSCNTLKDESVYMKKSLEDQQTVLEEKEKALRNAEYERDLLEKEKVLYDTQVKVCRRSKDFDC